MSNVTLFFKNALDDATLRVPGPFPDSGIFSMISSNLKVPVASKVMQFTANTTAAGSWMHLTLARVITPGLVAFCYHNMTQSAMVAIRAGTSSLDLDMMEGQQSDGRLVVTGTPGGCYFGESGTYAPINNTSGSNQCGRVDHDRATFWNGFRYSDDLQSSANNQGWVLSAGQIQDAQTVYMSANAQLTDTMPIRPGTYFITGEAKLVSGDGGFFAKVKDTAEHNSALQTAGTDWTPFSVSVTATTTNWTSGNAGFTKNGIPGTIKFRKLQVSYGQARSFKQTLINRRCVPRGLLQDPASQNDLLWSDDHTNAVYTKSATLTVTSNVQADLQGVVGMDRLNSSAASDNITQQITASGTSRRGAQYVFYAPLCTETNLAFQIIWSVGGTTQFVQVNVNPSTGAFVSTSTSGATLNLFGIDDYGDGYFRVYILGTGSDALNTKVNTTMTLATAGKAVVQGYWQNEANFISYPIRTTTAAKARPAESIAMTAANFDFFTNGVEGTLYTEAAAPPWTLNLPTGVENIFAISISGTAQWVHRFNTSPTSPTCSASTVGGWSTSTASAGVTANATVRMASRLRANDFAFAKDGSILDSSTAFGMIATPNQADIGVSASAGPCWLQRVTYWPRGLTNSELQSLTATGPSAIDFDSGWQPALRNTLLDEVGDTAWGKKLDVQVIIPAGVLTKYVRTFIRDFSRQANLSAVGNGYLGRLFVGVSSFQPATNIEYGREDGHKDYSSKTQVANGAYWTTARGRAKTVAMSMQWLTQAEANKLHELKEAAGTVEEVYYLPDSADLVYSQRYGFLGQLSDLNPLQFPFFANYSNAFQLEQKI